MTSERYRAIFDSAPRRAFLVIGDLMLDEFVWGRVSRISPEAPVPVVQVTGESYYPGGAANVARNLREFTPAVTLMGAVGDDEYGGRLLDLLTAMDIDVSPVHRDPAWQTSVKTRIVARQQQVVRVDRERHEALNRQQQERAMEYLDAVVESLDGIVVSDYGKGFVSQPLADHIARLAGAHGKILTVDPHPHHAIRWRGASAIKPNRAEAFLAAGMRPEEPVGPPLEDRALLAAGRRLLETWDTACVLITLGEQGMMLFQRGAEPYHTPTRAQAVFDVSGAGDTAVGVFTLGLAAGATPEQAAELANHASGIVVGKLGTATVTRDELEASFTPV